MRIARQSLAAHALVLPLDEPIHFGFLFALGETMLRFWNAPLAMLGGNNVHNVIPNIAYALAGKISLASLNTLTSTVDKIVTNTAFPNPLQILQVGLYFEFIGLLQLADAILFVLTLLGFVAIGLGTLLGPLMVPFLLVPRFNWIFYNWISFTIKYSFYQVVANGLAYIWANSFNFVISNVFGGSFSLANASTEILGLGLMTLAMAVSIWFVTHWSSDLFTGASNAGTSLASSVKGAVTKIFK